MGLSACRAWAREGPVDQQERATFEQEWAALSEGVFSGIADWRAQHPTATLREIEGEVDARLAHLRARVVERVAQQSAATRWRITAQEAEAATPRCPACGTSLESHGRRTRRLRTSGGQQIELQREYGVCPQCGQGLFPPG